MKNLGKTRYCLDLEDQALFGWNPSTLIESTPKRLRRFNEDKTKPSSTSMVVRTLDAKRDPFRT